MTFCGHHSDKLTTLSSWRHALEAKRVGLRILNFGGDAVDTRSATGRLMLNMFAAMAQFEREIMLERQQEGIAKAKADGKYKGRRPTARAKADEAVQMFRAGKRVAHIAKDLGIGRGSVYRALEAAGLTGESELTDTGDGPSICQHPDQR
jgi:DNA invertase Pin-like site-specific DNA recombinase